VLTTSASIAQAQNAEPRGLKGQGSAVQSMTGSGPSGKPSDPVAQPATFGGSTGGSGVATFPTASGNAGGSPPNLSRANVAAEKKGFQDAVQNLRQDRRAVEADRAQLQADRRSGNKEALAADKQKLLADRKELHEARQNVKKERQDLKEARTKAHEQRTERREQRHNEKQGMARNNPGGAMSGNVPQSQAQRAGPPQNNGAQAGRRPQEDRKPQFANGHDNRGGAQNNGLRSGLDRGGADRPRQPQTNQNGRGPQQGNHPAPMMGGGGHRGRA